MKNKLHYYAAIGLLLIVGCKKNESLNGDQSKSTIARAVTLGGAAPSAYGCFQLTNILSNKILEVRGDSTLLKAQYTPGNVQQYDNFNTGTAVSANQKWYLIQQGTGAITGSTPFKIMNVASGLFLEAPNGTSGTQLFQDHANSFPSQIWYLHQVSGHNYYYIQNSNGLVVTNHANATANGAPVTEESLANTNSQYWDLTGIVNEAYRDDAVVSFFHRPNTANTTVAFDEGKSIPLTNGANNGKILWITEDAYASTQLQSNGYLACQFFSYHNSALLQPNNTNWAPASTPNITTTSNASTGINQLEIIKSPGDHSTTYSWPGVGVEIGSYVYLYTYESANGSAPENQVLNKIAESTSGTTWGAVTRLTPNGMSGQTKIGYSLGMIRKPAGDTVYVYGSKSTGFNASSIFLARYPASNPSSWSFWRGHSWASTPDTSSTMAGQLTVGTGTTTQQNVMISYANGKYVMIQLDLGYFCDPSAHDVYISTATSPFGPFTAPKKVFTINDWYNGHLAKYYTPAIHPEFNTSRNELLITYCLNYNGAGGSCSTQTCFNNNQDSNAYQIKGVRIPYSLIGL